LTLPTDLIEAKISSAHLRYSLVPFETKINKDAENDVIRRIYDLFKQANADAVVIVDAGVVRHNCRLEVVQFLLETKLPVYATPLGKTIIDESYGRYGGVYIFESASEPSLDQFHRFISHISAAMMSSEKLNQQNS
jgi:pyruvate decarboxylase